VLNTTLRGWKPSRKERQLVQVSPGPCRGINRATEASGHSDEDCRKLVVCAQMKAEMFDSDERLTLEKPDLEVGHRRQPANGSSSGV